ncbi:MAG: heavy-metal-associated domain-containing protein [Roseimicrobium sp.]
MRHLFLLPAFVLCSFASLRAGDATQATGYTATVTGVVCSACKMHVTAAFKKLPGVENVNFAKGDAEGTAKVTFNSSAPTLTKEDAVKALGVDAKTYNVVSLEKAK